MSLLQRIKVLVEKEGTKSKFARKVNLSATYVSNMLKREKGSLNYDTVMNILFAYPEISPMWFLMGEGDMYLSKEASDQLHIDSEDSEEMMEKVMIMMQKRLDQELDNNHKVIELLEQRVELLENQLKEADPNRAKSLGIK